MNAERFNVVLDGTTLRGQTVATVAADLAKLIKRDNDFAAHLLRGAATKIKSGVDAATGARYIEALERVGAAAHLEPETLEIDADIRIRAEPSREHQASTEATKTATDHVKDASQESAEPTNTNTSGPTNPKVWDPMWAAAVSFIGGLPLSSFLIARNWQALDQRNQARTAWIWFAGSVVAFVVGLFALAYRNLFVAGVVFAYVLAWAVWCVVPQQKYLTGKFGTRYRRKSRFILVLIALLTFSLFAGIAGTLERLDATHLLATALTQPPPPQRQSLGAPKSVENWQNKITRVSIELPRDWAYRGSSVEENNNNSAEDFTFDFRGNAKAAVLHYEPNSAAGYTIEQYITHMLEMNTANWGLAANPPRRIAMVSGLSTVQLDTTQEPQRPWRYVVTGWVGQSPATWLAICTYPPNDDARRAACQQLTSALVASTGKELLRSNPLDDPHLGAGLTRANPAPGQFVPNTSASALVDPDTMLATDPAPSQVITRTQTVTKPDPEFERRMREQRQDWLRDMRTFGGGQ